MSGQEIKERIAHNDRLIEELSPTTFVLNKQIQDALEENRRLRSVCQHEFAIDSYTREERCIYCGAARILD